MKRLVLFDIDGTLLHGGSLWRECFEGAFRDCCPDIQLKHVSFNGKTDPQICHELMGHQPSAEIMSEPVRRILDEYLNRVEKTLPSRAGEVEALPSAHALLNKLASLQGEGLQLGLLTGNVRRGAKIKLSAVQLDHYFDFGVFGDDHWNRYKLPSIAAERAKQRFGVEFKGKEVVVIGDTIHDVKCGESIGVRSIAVGTGRNVDRAELLGSKPDYFFEDFSDISSVIQAICG